MAKDWKLKADPDGGQTGQFLDDCEIRENADGSYDLIAVLARHPAQEAPFEFPQFAYRGWVWDVGVGTFAYGPDSNEAHGSWRNNARKGGPPAEEDGTFTGQAGSGGGVEEEGREDAASAGA